MQKAGCIRLLVRGKDFPHIAPAPHGSTPGSLPLLTGRWQRWQGCAPIPRIPTLCSRIPSYSLSLDTGAIWAQIMRHINPKPKPETLPLTSLSHRCFLGSCRPLTDMFGQLEVRELVFGLGFRVLGFKGV